MKKRSSQFPQAAKASTKADWSQWDPWAGLWGLAGIALPLFTGFATGHVSGGAIAAGGALYIGVGSYDKSTRNPTLSLVLGSLLMALAAVLGSLAGQQPFLSVPLVFLWAFGAGLLSILGPPLSFIGIKTLVSLLIATGYPSSLTDALDRGELVLAGALTQTLLFHLEAIFWSRWGAPRRSASAAPVWLHTFKALKPHFSWRSGPFQHGSRMALGVTLAEALCHSLLAHNAYWLPITVAIVLRPDFEQTLERGFSRMAGTVLGVVATSLIVLWLQPTGLTLAFLTLPCAWACFSLFRVNYALYSIAITAYVVFMLSFVGLPESSVVWNRLLATLTGGTFALVFFTLWPKGKNL